MMKTSLFKGTFKGTTCGAAAVLLALGVLGSTQALAGIASTKHNLGSTGEKENKFPGTGEICVFCHTPHGADTAAVVPLWNRTMSTSGTFQTYSSLGTSSLDGATAPVGSVSLACLSCHDGTQAMSTMINTPGSGTAVLSGTWTGANQENNGEIKSTLITHIGKDLQNDHPIGIQYAGGPKSGSTFSSAVSAGEYSLFRDPDFRTATRVALNSKPVWYVDTGTAGRQKTDMQLYTRTETAFVDGDSAEAAAGTLQPYVECASCHDPHTETPTFLRIENTGSAVCLACHIK